MYYSQNRTSHCRNFHTLAVEDKNVFFTIFFKHHCYGCKISLLGYGCLSQHLMSESSCPDFFCKKFAIKSFAKFKVKHLWQSFFFKKLTNRLQHMCFPVNFLKFAGANFWQDICKQPTLNVLYFMIFQERKH